MDISRICALEVLNAVEKSNAYSNLAMNNYIKKYDVKEAGFVRQVVYGVLENRIYIDYILSFFVKTGLEKMKVGTKNILRMGIYQQEFMDSVPNYAAINESVELAKKFAKGQSGFVNGVLRNFLREKEKGNIRLPDPKMDQEMYLSIKYSYDVWIVKYWIESYGLEMTEKLLACGNEVPPLCARVNLLKINKEKIIDRLKENGYEAKDGVSVPEAIVIKGSGIVENAAFGNGLIQIQDESSMMAVDLLDPKPGDVFLDVCAAPGGKTIFAGERMKNQGRIIACDIHEHKLDLLSKTAKKHGLDIVAVKKQDGRKKCQDFIGIADKVLVDVPCSGLGVIRRKPEIKFTKSRIDVEVLSKIQMEILFAACDYVKVGGSLLYSTCTISPMENDAIVAAFMQRKSGFQIEKKMQLTPLEDGLDGFFMCKFIRTGESFR